MDSLRRSAFFQGSVSFRATIVRYGMANRFVKDCRVGRKSCALLAMTRLIGFAGKRNNFRNETFERRCGAIPRKKRPHKTKNVCFPNKNAPFWCHCEAATRPWQSLSRRHGIPWRSTGARNKKKSLSQKTWIRCVVPLPLPLFQGSVSFRPTIVRSGMANRSVKDCRVGRKSCALLAMTNLVGFAGKRSNFRNETFERRDAGRHRAKTTA